MSYEALFKAKKTGDIYSYHGDGKMCNITKGAKGKLDEKVIKDMFTIPIGLNNIAKKNPLVIELIAKLSLQLEPLNEDETYEIIEHQHTQ